MGHLVLDVNREMKYAHLMDFLDLGSQIPAFTLYFYSPDPGGGGAHF